MRQNKPNHLITQIGWSLLICLGLFWGEGCSSLPKHKRVALRSETFAAMKMRLARASQQQRDYARALALYGEAYNFYTGIDDVLGKIQAGLAISRQYFYLSQPVESDRWLALVSTLIDGGMPQMAVSRTLLLLEMAFTREEYIKVITLAGDLSPGNPEGQLEVDSYVLVAKAKLKQPYQVELQRVEANAALLHQGFMERKLNDPEVLALAYYFCGYVYLLEEKWQGALEYFEKAKWVDGLLDNAYGVGKDLYGMGRCYEKLGDKKKAASSYTRALEIFILLKDSDMEQKARTKLSGLSN